MNEKDKRKIEEDFNYLAGVCEYCGLYDCGINPDPRREVDRQERNPQRTTGEIDE